MPRKSPAPQLLTYEDLVLRYGVPVNTLRQWVRRGKLPEPDYRVGKSPAWLPSSLEGVAVADRRFSE